MPREETGETKPTRRVIGWEEFGELSKKLALQVAERGPIDAVVGIARGGAILGCALSFLLGKDYFGMRLKKQGGATRVVSPPPADVRGMRVALVDDVSQSGETFKIALHELARVGCRDVLTVALVRREPGFRPDVFALEIASKTRFPWAREQLVDGKFVKR
jgi:hypoxanthine phosphoribosyltransferase